MAARTVLVVVDGVIKPLPSGDALQDAGGNALGTGSGNVSGPATNTDGFIPQWNGANSLLLKDGLQFDTDGTLAANSATRVPAQSAVKTYVDQLLAANDAMVYKGVIDCSSNPNYPAAAAGDTYRVSIAGKIGGASGPNVEAGDILLCNTDATTSGDHATKGTFWNIIQVNIDGAVTTTDTVAVDETIVTQNGTSGKVYKKSTKTIAEVERKRMAFNVDVYLDGQNQLSGANVMDITMPYAGYLVASSIKMKSARTAGSIAIEPHINGSGITPTGLDMDIDDNPTTKNNKTVAYGTANYNFSAGDTVGFLVTSTSFTPLANVATLCLIVEVAV